MGKSVGFIGNFKGKLGNAVGYKVSQSNSGTNQGVRVYQPNIKNPKSAAQAEQRAKYAPIFATYRALKMIIDRGNESKPYGNASRVAWLKKAFRAEIMPWFVKGAQINAPVCCQLTQGSLSGLNFECGEEKIIINAPSMQQGTMITKIGALSTALKTDYPSLKNGDQITIISVNSVNGALETVVFSFIIDPTSTETTPFFAGQRGQIDCYLLGAGNFGSVIVSREGANGEHLRSTSSLVGWNEAVEEAPFDDASTQSAIASYMATDSANADWAEESIQ